MKLRELVQQVKDAEARAEEVRYKYNLPPDTVSLWVAYTNSSD